MARYAGEDHMRHSMNILAIERAVHEAYDANRSADTDTKVIAAIMAAFHALDIPSPPKRGRPRQR